MIRQLVLGAYMFTAREKISMFVSGFGATNGSMDMFVLGQIVSVFV